MTTDRAWDRGLARIPEETGGHSTGRWTFAPAQMGECTPTCALR